MLANVVNVAAAFPNHGVIIPTLMQHVAWCFVCVLMICILYLLSCYQYIAWTSFSKCQTTQQTDWWTSQPLQTQKIVAEKNADELFKNLALHAGDVDFTKVKKVPSEVVPIDKEMA